MSKSQDTPPKIVEFPRRTDRLTSAQVDAMMLAAFLQMDTVYNWLKNAPPGAESDDCAEMAADALHKILDVWEKKREISQI